MVNGVVRLPDDNIEIIRNSDDFVRLIHDKLGFDTGQMARSLADLTIRRRIWRIPISVRMNLR